MVQPYPLGGKIYGITGSAVTDATTEVLIINVTRSVAEGERVLTSGNTDPTDGAWALDLSALATADGTLVDWVDGDKLQIFTYDENGRYYSCRRHTVDASNNPHPVPLDLYFHVGQKHLRSGKITGGWVSNISTSTQYFELYNVEDDSLICRVQCALSSTSPLPAGIIGVPYYGGLCIVYETGTQNIHFVRAVK